MPDTLRSVVDKGNHGLLIVLQMFKIFARYSKVESQPLANLKQKNFIKILPPCKTVKNQNESDGSMLDFPIFVRTFTKLVSSRQVTDCMKHRRPVKYRPREDGRKRGRCRRHRSRDTAGVVRLGHQRVHASARTGRGQSESDADGEDHALVVRLYGQLAGEVEQGRYNMVSIPFKPQLGVVMFSR